MIIPVGIKQVVKYCWGNENQQINFEKSVSIFKEREQAERRREGKKRKEGREKEKERKEGKERKKPLHGLSEVWTIWCIVQLHIFVKILTLLHVVLTMIFFFFLRKGLCSSGSPGTGFTVISVFCVLWLKACTILPVIIMNGWMLNKLYVFVIAFLRDGREGSVVKSTGCNSRG